MIQSIPVMELIPLVKEKARIEDRDMLQVFDEKDDETRIVLYQEMALKIAYSNQYPPEFDLDLELQQALPMNPIVVRQLRENKDNHTTGFIELTQRIFEKRRKDFQDWLNKAKKKSEERKTAKELGLYDPSITTTMSTPEKPSTSNKPSTTMMSTTTTVMSTTIKPIINAKQSTTIVPITITKMSTTIKPSTSANPSTTIIPTTKMSTTVKPSTNANPSTTMMPTTITKMSTTVMPTTSTKQNPASTTTPPSGANARNAEVLTTTIREPQSESEEKEVPDAIADSVRRSPRRPAEASSKFAGETNVVGSPSHIEYMKQTYDNQEQFRRNLTHSGVNSKLQFVAEKLQEDMKRNFEKAFEEACLMKNRLFIVWWAMTELNPTVAVRHILNRKDVIATFAGPEVVAISQCKTVVAKKIIYDHRINETCYAHTPIRNEQDETFFVIPGTRDLIRSSTVIECDKVQPSVFHVNGTYRAGDIAANVTRLHGIGPMMSTQLQRLNFNSTDIFEGAKGSAFPLTLAVSYGANLAALQRQQSELLHILVGQQFLSDKAKMLSEGTADFFHDATVAVDTVLTNTRNWMVNYLLGIGFVPVLIVICIFVCAIIFKLFAYRYFMNLMFGASKSLMVNNVNVVPDNNREEAYEMKEPSAPMLDQEVRIKQQGSQAAREQEAVHGQLLRPALPFFSYIPILLPAVFAATTEGSPGVLPYIPISLEDRSITALWDSGASISYTRLSTIHYLGIFNVTKTETKATTANGTKITFHGSVPLGVRIANTYIDHEFLVSPDDCCPAAVLLGTDFMQKLEQNCTPPTLHLTKGILTVGDVEIKLNQPGEVVYKQTNNVSQLTSRYSYRLTPGENKIITAKIRDEEVDPHHQWILLPEEESDISFGKIVFHPNEAEQIEFPVTNRGSTVVNIRAGQKIGHATKTEPIISALEGQELYIPPEADWEEKLPELTISTDFKAELNVKDCELSQQGQIELRKIVARNKGAFYNGDGNIGCFTGPLEHSIELRTDMPFPRSRTYRIPLGKQAEVEKQVQTLLKQEIIEPSTSLFTSPIVLVKKRDDTFRFTTDFRQLNNVTRKQTYVIPHIHDIVDLAAGARFFSNLDLISGFFQIPLREKDRPLTAFTTTSGTYQYRRMPMGLCSSPHTFQCAVRILQSKVQCRLYTYLDDLLIVSDSEKGHLEDIEEVLKAIENLGMKIRLKKCTFGAAEVHFLGLIIGRQGVKPNPKKVQAIAEFPRPKTPTAVRSVIGMANYFRRFVKNFATIAHPLYELTTKTPETFVWEEHHEEAFEQLKKALSTAPVLASLTPNRPFIIESDGSTIAIGVVLLQSAEEGQQPHPIAYASRKMVKAERNYPPIEIEALALVFAVTEFRTYILGTKTTAITDHRPLTSLLKRKDLLGRLSKYQLVLQEYDIEITYRPGKSNDVGDALSRYCQDEQNPPRPTPKSSNKKIPKQESEASVNHVEVSRNELVEVQQKTEWIRQAIDAIQQNTENNSKYTARYDVIDGLLCAKRQELFAAPAIVLPRDRKIIDRLVKMFHESPHLSAHLGISKTLNNLKRRFQWTNMYEDVKNIVARCLECKRRKVNAHEDTVEPLGRMDVPSFPFQRVHIDVMGPLPVTTSGNRYILSISDAFSKTCITTPIVTQDASTIAKVLVEKIYTIHGCPVVVVTDNGTSFLSETFKKTLALCGAKHSITPPYHKDPNGQVERCHRTLEELISTFVNKNQDDWDTFLPNVTMAMNCAVSEATGVSPFHTVYGREPRLPEDAEWKTQLRTFFDQEEYSNVLHLQLQETWTSIRAKLERNGAKMQTYQAQSKRVAERTVRQGDQVLLKRAPPRNKLAPKLHGPYTVTDMKGSTVTVQDDRGKPLKAHKNEVRVFQRHPGADKVDEEKDTSEQTTPGEKDTPEKTNAQDPNIVATPTPPRRSKRLAQKKKVTFHQ